ncbi:MAG: hypothetical protein D3917_18245 [Candidatus Electrothrix sp. AX5]|nr:hypothetical protein [Candidatus Electrothrix sp. AX5]
MRPHHLNFQEIFFLETGRQGLLVSGCQAGGISKQRGSRDAQVFQAVFSLLRRDTQVTIETFFLPEISSHS